MSKKVARVLAKTLGVLALCLGGCRGGDSSNITATTVREGFPAIGNISQSFQWGKIDQNLPPLIGNGDIGGTFDPFGGTTFDELRYGSGARRDIRTLLLTQLMVPDYWVLEDQGAHFLDPRYYRPASLRKYLAYGAPFNLLLRPQDEQFPQAVTDHQQLLDISQGLLTTKFRVGENSYEVECFISPSESLLAYRIIATAPMRFEVTGKPSPSRPVTDDRGIPSRRYQETKNGYTVNESHDELVVLKQVSNVFCPAYVAVSGPGLERQAQGFHLPAGEHYLFIAIGHPSSGQARAQAINVSRRAAKSGYTEIRSAHTAWWRQFWERSYISIPNKRLEQMWYRSVYYLASCLPRRVKSFSPEGGYGIFPAFAGYHPQDSVYHLFSAISSNHPELGKAQIEHLLETLPVAQAAARNIYYLEGARYPWHSTPGLLPYLPGHSNDEYYLHEHHVNGWIAEFVRRYLNAYGWDQPQTRRYYPILREIARFFSSMLTARGEQLEIVYVPSAGQEETGHDLNQKNIFDILVAAKWSLSIAGETAERLRVDQEEAKRWKEEASRLSLDYCLRSDSTYGSFEGDEGHTEKVPIQLIGVVMTSLFNNDRARFLKTYDYLRGAVKIDTCSWSPGYYAISAARLKKPEEALRSLEEGFKFSRPPWIMFIENTYQVPGRMPYYLAAHALFVQGVNEMLLQDWSGKVELFPACPFDEAAFKLRGNNRIVEARIDHGKIEVLADVLDRKN
jgi:Glycosyl hydrolase family 65 central catalytic domain/Glycosyl hydrolase family 65, N-terminal domain